MKKSIVLLSSGLDSTVNLAIANQKTDVCLALTFDYGQKSAAKEIENAGNICEKHYNIPHQVIKLPWLETITKTALVNKTQTLPYLLEKELNRKSITKQSAKLVWVPNRNAVFINIAASFAESMEADLIITGFNAEEAATFPDNSKSFVKAVNKSLKLSTLKHPQVISYTQKLNKQKIVKKAVELKIPFEFLWVCYNGDDLMCGKCESCLRTIRAFKKNNNFWLIEKRFKTITND
jgi:7-cyano-7-deazaguanine synthase